MLHDSALDYSELYNYRRSESFEELWKLVEPESTGRCDLAGVWFPCHSKYCILGITQCGRLKDAKFTLYQYDIFKYIDVFIPHDIRHAECLDA